MRFSRKSHAGPSRLRKTVYEKKKKTTVFQSTYVVVLQKVEKKDVIYTETVYNNKGFDKNLFWM